jgi:putative membrane protein
MPLHTLIGWLLVIALLAFLLLGSGGMPALGMVARLGWGLLPVVAFHVVPLYVDVLAWRCVFPKPLPSAGKLLVIRWLGEGANSLLPIPHLGEALRARLASTLKQDGVAASTAVMVDITIGLLTLVPFTALGLLLLALKHEATAELVFILLPLILCGAVLFLMQRLGLLGRLLAVARRIIGPTPLSERWSFVPRFDLALQSAYTPRPGLLRACLWRFAGWLVGTGEIWLALALLGEPADPGDALILESLSQAARTVAFAIPGGLGVQDAAMILLAAQLGLGGEIGLGLSLIKRCRELALGLPALAVGGLALTRRRHRDLKPAP